MTRLSVSRLLIASVAALALWPSAGAAQEITRSAEGTISLRAKDVPLDRLLQALGELGPLTKIVVKDAVGARLVTVTLDHVTPTQAIVQVLGIAGVDYVLGGGRLVVADSSFSGLGPGKPAPPAAATWNSNANDGEKARATVDPGEARDTEDTAAGDNARDTVDSQIRAAEIARALSAPALPIPAGAPVDLPFPGPDGRTPLSVVKSPAGRVGPPFPATTGATPAAVSSPASDPRIQQLIDALTPKRPRGK